MACGSGGRWDGGLDQCDAHRRGVGARGGGGSGARGRHQRIGKLIDENDAHQRTRIDVIDIENVELSWRYNGWAYGICGSAVLCWSQLNGQFLVEKTVPGTCEPGHVPAAAERGYSRRDLVVLRAKLLYMLVLCRLCLKEDWKAAENSSGLPGVVRRRRLWKTSEGGCVAEAMTLDL